MHRFSLLVLATLLAASASAADGSRRPWPLRVLLGLKEFVDSSAVQGLDPRYVGQPERPWSAEVRSDITKSTLSMTARDYVVEEVDEWGAKTHGGPTLSVGAWAGYRGYGFGYSRAIVGDQNKTLSFGATGGSYGVNLRINSYESDIPTITMRGTEDGVPYYEEIDWETEAPMRMRSLFLDAYYMFNRKRFSYAAAYDQSLTQLRSAGSAVIGGMYYHSRAAFADQSNFILHLLLNDVGKLTFTQGCLGAGYAYNWVPVKGLLVSVMAVPMLTFHNMITTYTYKTTWQDEQEDFVTKPTGSQDTFNHISWTFDTRLAASYQWSRYYLRAYSHYNMFRYWNNNDHGYTSYWTVYSAFGVRF